MADSDSDRRCRIVTQDMADSDSERRCRIVTRDIADSDSDSDRRCLDFCHKYLDVLLLLLSLL